MRFVRLLLLVILFLLSSMQCVLCEPSAGLAAAMVKRCAAVDVGKSDPVSAARGVLKNAGVEYRIGFEQADSASVERRAYKVEAGTLKEQLDRISEVAGMAYQTNGDWINFYPKGAASDANYVMNKRLPGTIVVAVTGSTDISKWLSDNHVSFARVLSGIRRPKVDYQKIVGNTIVLENPTLRQCVNAHEEVFGFDTSCLRIRQIVDSDEPKIVRTVIDQQSYNSNIPVLLKDVKKG